MTLARVLRRAFAATILLLVTFTVLEAVARATYGPFTGGSFDPNEWASRRALRLAAIESRLAEAGSGTGLYRLHPYVGYVGRAGVKPWPHSDARFNSFGMLSENGYEYPYGRREGEWIVGVFGGSVAEGFANTAEAELKRALAERDPRFRTRKVRLLPLGTGGYKQPQQLAMLEYVLLAGFDLDVVLNLDGYNDVVLAAENATLGLDVTWPSSGHYETALAAQTGGVSLDAVKDIASVHDAYRREAAILSALGRWPLPQSALAALFGETSIRASEQRVGDLNRRVIARTQSAAAQRPSVSGDPGRQAAIDPADARDRALAEPEGTYERASAMWAGASALMYTICRERGLVYVHVLQPNQYVEGSKPLSSAERRIAYAPDNPWSIHAKRGYPHLSDAGRGLRARGIPFYDMTGVFSDHTEDLYTDDCCHFSPSGHAILAQSVAVAILTELGRQRAAR